MELTGSPDVFMSMLAPDLRGKYTGGYNSCGEKYKRFSGVKRA